jgi:general secretion pathway protein D
MLCPAAESPRSLAKDAAQAEKRGDVVKAYLLYSQAAAADPKNRSYWVRSQALRTRALRQSNSLPAVLTQAVPPVADPEAVTAVVGDAILPAEEEESRRPLPPAELGPTPGLKSFHIRGDAKSLFQQVTQAFGLDTVFDIDYVAGQPVRFDLDEVNARNALRALEAATSSFVVPLSPKLLMIYKDTQQKRTEAEPTMAVTLSLPHPVSVQEAQELARAVQQCIEIQRFAVDSNRRLVLIKDRVSKVRAAQELYSNLLTHRSQVLIEVELLDVADTFERNYGMTLPTSSAMSFLGRSTIPSAARRGLRIIPDIMPGFTRFLLAGGGLTTIAFAITDASAFASYTRSSALSLYRSQIRAVDSQAATLHVGDKYPIITQQYMGDTTGVNSLAIPPTFNFEDLGLSLKITPRVHSQYEVSLTVEAEYKVLGSGSYNGIPVISNRKFASTVRLRNGEYGVLAGMISSSEARSVSGLPFLAQMPLLHHVLASNTSSRNSGEALVVIKPQIIDSAASENPSRTIYTGTEARWITLP